MTNIKTEIPLSAINKGHWSTHLHLSSAPEELREKLRLFLTIKLPFWMELPVDPASVLRAALEVGK